MGLADYFEKLIARVEASDIGNNGTDKNGFFLPTRAVLLRHLKLLKDLHAKPLARPMVKDSWRYVSDELPPEWLVLSADEKIELQTILGEGPRPS